MEFPPPTDEEKKLWANSDIVARGELGGIVYELKENGSVAALKPHNTQAWDSKKKNPVRMLTLVGYISNPTPTLVEQIKEVSKWN